MSHREFLPRRGFVPVGAGEVRMWGGDACVAPQEGECTRNQDEGDAHHKASPPTASATPAPTGTK
jgi:hypothetical protein